MSEIERRLEQMGLVLPQPLKRPAGVKLPFPFVSVRGERVFISGHGPQDDDGSVGGPFGKVGADVSPEDAAVLARKTGLSILASLKRELGELDRIVCWCKILGMVNSAPDFTRQPAVINGFSELILDVFGQDRGRHARSAVGVASLPFNIAVEIEGEVMIAT